MRARVRVGDWVWVGVQYSGAGEGKPLPTVLAIETDSINRGACIAAFSQYPGEVTVFFLMRKPSCKVRNIVIYI